MTKFSLLLFFSFSLVQLSAVHRFRLKGDAFIETKSYDSAAYCYSKVCEITQFNNATDYIVMAALQLALKDTVAAKRNIVFSIDNGGADTNIIFSYYQFLTAADRSFFKNYFGESFKERHKSFLARVDTSVARKMEDIFYLDQLLRKARYSDANSDAIKAMGAYVDSVNYVRIVELINTGKYPNLKNFGLLASKYDVVLMHVTDWSEQRWAFIFNFLKKEVLNGNISQSQLVSIANRHYTAASNCTYYGSAKKNAPPLCNCKDVDVYRTAIGLDSLKTEFKRRNTNLPDCYHER